MRSVQQYIDDPDNSKKRGQKPLSYDEAMTALGINGIAAQAAQAAKFNRFNDFAQADNSLDAVSEARSLEAMRRNRLKTRRQKENKA